MPDAPCKYHLINEAQLEAARRYWPQVTDKTWVLILKRTYEPMLLNRPPHKGIGFARITVSQETVEGMCYLKELDILILISGETELAKLL